MADEEPHLNRTEARGASSNHVTRYVLPISMALLVIVFVALLVIWR